MKNVTDEYFDVVVRVSYKTTSRGGGSVKEERTKVDIEVPGQYKALDLVRDNLSRLTDEMVDDIDGQILKLIE